MTTKESIIVFICVLAVAVFGFTAWLKQAEINQMRANRIVNGECRFEGAECPNAYFLMKDYQIVLQQDDYVIMDGDRVVGVLPQSGALDSLIMADNL